MKFPRLKLLLATFTLIGVFAGLISNISVAEAAFGTSPPWVKNDHMLPGTSFEQVVNLSRNETETPMKATVKISGDKALLKWVTIENESKLIMKKGQTILPMKVTVNIPQRAAVRNYLGSIYVSLAPVMVDPSLGGGEVAITFGANIDVNITVVGDKVIDYQVKSISVDPLEVGTPFKLNMEIENKGNTDFSDPIGQIDIYNSAQTEIIKSLTFIPLKEPVLPDEMKMVKMIFEDVKLEPGEYWVAVKVIKDGKTTYENRLFQEVKAKVIPVVTPEDAISKKPSLPKVDQEEAPTAETPVAVAPVAEVRSAAPIILTAPENGTNTMFLIFGLAGFGLALIVLIGIIIVLVFFLKNSQQAAMRRDNMAPAQTQIPVQAQPPVQAPVQPTTENKVTETK